MIMRALLLVCLLSLTSVVGASHAEGDYDHYTNDFAVEVRGGDLNVAELVSVTHGCELVREIKSLGSTVYHFTHQDVKRRSKRSAEEFISQLTGDPNVVRVEQQKSLWRDKRGVPGRHRRDIVHDKQSELDFPTFEDKNVFQRYYPDESSKFSSRDELPGEDVGNMFNDPFFKDQWYLNNVGQSGGPKGMDVNVVPVWKSGITGKGVVVCILDDGIDHTHPDLKVNYDPEASTDLNDKGDKKKDPMPNVQDSSNSHGTRCAGEVAAAANNSNCGVGIAYNAKIGGVRMLDGTVTDLLEATALTFHNQHIDIYSASWGPRDNGKTLEGPGHYTSKALEEGITKGRGGKGSIFVWATGNGGSKDDCACDGYVSSPYSLSIGSISDEGLSTYYSEICSSTMAVIYTGGSHRPPGSAEYRSPKLKIVTTDLKGGCTLNFQGTSAAAPLAAGCFALVLEANPSLTWRDMQHLVVHGSKIPTDQEKGWTVNGAGHHVNSKFGFGAIDCGAMVELAQEWKNVGRQHVCEVESDNQPVDIPARDKVKQTLTVDGCKGDAGHEVSHLEHVHVKISLNHSRRGDLHIWLTSPSGTVSEILKVRVDDDGTEIDFPFMTVHKWGEKPAGKWKLIIADEQPKSSDRGDNKGVLNSWSLTLYGTSDNDKGKGKQEKSIELGHEEVSDHKKRGSGSSHVPSQVELKHIMQTETVQRDSIEIKPIVDEDGNHEPHKTKHVEKKDEDLFGDIFNSLSETESESKREMEQRNIEQNRNFRPLESLKTEKKDVDEEKLWSEFYDIISDKRTISDSDDRQRVEKTYKKSDVYSNLQDEIEKKSEMPSQVDKKESQSDSNQEIDKLIQYFNRALEDQD